MHKHAQLKMFETIGVLIVFFILLGIAMSIYFFLQKTSYAADQQHKQQLETFALIQKMLYLPELDCNFLQTTQDNCFEKLKVEAVRDLLKTDPTAPIDYFPTFGFSTITITPIYPAADNIILYQRVPASYQHVFKTQIPVILKDTLTETNAFATLEITRYVTD